MHRRTDWEKSSEKWNWPDPSQRSISGKKSEEAARLLAFTDKSLISISDYLGFSSQSHFARVFKKYIGMTPSEYRSR
ncbi:MAG: helix-turn-helix transcriptional regulator [Clostridia bacterium]|nr:helix-turn-helix transcriptional regulator [Clostridia bacterium]